MLRTHRTFSTNLVFLNPGESHPDVPIVNRQQPATPAQQDSLLPIRHIEIDDAVDFLGVSIHDHDPSIHRGEVDTIPCDQPVVWSLYSNVDSPARVRQADCVTLAESGDPDFAIQLERKIRM